MARTITNFAELSDPVTASIDAQTASMEAVAACQGAGISSIYNTVLCGETSAESLQPSSPVCYRSETLTDFPDPGDETIRTTGSDGSIVEVVTYADGSTCTFNRQSADPVNSTVGYDENCNEILVGVTTSCKARNLGEPYPRYFVPLVSDYGNQVYCVTGSTYAFAWTGVGNLELEQFLLDYAAQIDLEDPTNQYVAIVASMPYVCGQDAEGNQVNATNYVAGQDADGNDYYCFPNLSGTAHTTNDPLNLTSSTFAFDNMGDAIICPPYTLDGLQVTQQARLNAFSPILSICPEWTGKPDPVEVPPADDENGGILSLLGLCDGVQVPSVAGKTYQESYVMLWKDYWECEKKDKTMRNALLAVQGATALAGLVTSIQTYNKILDKQLDILCDVTDDTALLAQCSASLLGTDEEPGILKTCQANLLEGHNDRIGTINSRGQAFCEMADDEIDCYEQLWRPIVKKHVPHIASELHTMLHNGKLSSEYTTSWADGLQGCVTENMLPELKRQFAPLLSSSNCAATNLNDWRQRLNQKAFDLQDHFNRAYKEGEATMIPEIMDMSTCMVQRVCELRDWLYELAQCDQETYKGYQKGEIPQAEAAMASAAQIIPKVVESVQWLEQNIPAATDLFNCYKEGISKLNPQLFTNARDLAPEIQACFKWFKDNGDKAAGIYDKCYKKQECRLVTTQLDFATKLVAQVQDSLSRLDNWSERDRVMYDENFRSVEASKTTALVNNGHDSSDQLHQFGQWWDERTKQFHSVFEDNWLPCDIANLQKHCQMWEEVNPLQEMHKNADEVQLLGTEAIDSYRNGIIRANGYLGEVFKQADTFDYCVEDPSVHHVRRRVEQALDELEKCTPRYSTGHLDAQRTALKIGGARAEGAAYASAARWKWWANEQLDAKGHDRKMAMLTYMDSIASRGLSANAASTAAQEALLSHMREAIARGNIHTANMQDSGRSAITVKGNEVDAMLRMIQLWHFWPELAASENGQFNQSVHQVHDQARNLVQLGHFWPGQASQDKRQAASISQEAIGVGVEMSRIGQFYLSEAERMNSARAAIGQQAGQLGNQFAQTGHSLHKMAVDSTHQSNQQAIAAGSLGVQAGQLGAQHMATALDVENKMTLNALEHVKAGMSALSIGVDFLSEVRQTQQLAGSYGINAATQLMNLFETGRRQNVLAMEANQQCKQTEFEMLCKAKDFVMQNYNITQGSLHSGTSGTLNAGNNLLQQQGNNSGSAFGLLGNSLEGLLTSNSSPPFPTGAPAFSSGGGFY